MKKKKSQNRLEHHSRNSHVDGLIIVIIRGGDNDDYDQSPFEVMRFRFKNYIYLRTEEKKQKQNTRVIRPLCDLQPIFCLLFLSCVSSKKRIR